MIIIKLIQETLNKTQQDIANDIGVSRQTISMWLSGYKITKKHMKVISDVYNIPENYINKTQESGYHFSESDKDFIKNCLINRDNLYDSNVVYKLLELINYPIIKSNNYGELLEKKIDFSKTNIIPYSNDFVFNDNNNYILLIEMNNKKILDFMDLLKNIDNKPNVYYLIRESNKDQINIIKIGE